MPGAGMQLGRGPFLIGCKAAKVCLSHAAEPGRTLTVQAADGRREAPLLTTAADARGCLWRSHLHRRALRVLVH